MYLHNWPFMFLPTPIYATTATNVELIDNMSLTCVKNAQATRTSFRNSKNSSNLSQGLHHAYSSKVGGEKRLCLLSG